MTRCRSRTLLPKRRFHSRSRIEAGKDHDATGSFRVYNLGIFIQK